MRSTFFILMAVVTALSLRATDHLITVGAKTLEGWMVTGADKSTLGKAPDLVLPPGAALSRKFAGNALVVRLASQPAFSEKATDWPILQMGPLNLAMTVQDNQRRLILAINDRASLDLPLADTAAANPLVDFVLAFDPSTGFGLISFQGDLRSFETEATAGPVEVMLSAGAGSAWPQEKLEILLLANLPGEEGDSPASRQRNSVKKLEAALHLAAARGGSESGFGGLSNGALHRGEGGPGGAQQSGLEVFTPPAVRRAQAERAVVAAIKTK